ncbi:transcription factor E2F3 [Oopsacas minuta]|uniref:Transcription factor E2F3 n=1 Tax=Oopsacas minuta TaxID=111878 RepID=A0AAV7JJH9_9METZ|nr:transcription factor E2F3 [Oopsacas minuta]
MSACVPVNESVEMVTPKTCPRLVPEKMPRRLVSSELKPQPYTKAKSTKVPKLPVPTLNRSHSACHDLKHKETGSKRKETSPLSNSCRTESASSLLDSGMLSTSLCDLSKQDRSSKKVKRKLNMDDKANCCSSSSLSDVPDLNSRESWPDHYKQGCGTPSTLQDQTRQFIIETLHSPTPEIDVNLIERNLNMPKRRVYDILGVLEGIGWVKKSEKNKYAWLSEVAVRMETARKRVVFLENETKRIDGMILDAEKYLTDMFSDEPASDEFTQFRNNLYLTEEDIAQTEDLTKNLIAVRTNNPNLRIEIPETKEGYELILHSESTPIEAYTISPDGNFTSIADSSYNAYSNPIANPYSHNFDPFFQEFLRSSDNSEYEAPDYLYGSSFSDNFEDIYAHNFSLSEIFDSGPARISQTHV